MGASCCVAARHKDLTQRRSTQYSAHRNVRHSPSWSVRRNNRTHIEDVPDNVARISHGNSRNVGFEIKSGVDTGTEGFLDGGSALDSYGSPNWHKFPTYLGTAGNPKGNDTVSNHLQPGVNISIGSDSLSKGMEPMKLLATGSLRKSKPSTLTTPPTASRGESSSSHSHSLPADPSSSTIACQSPCFQLSRQISDAALKSLNEKILAEGGQSRALSICSNDLSVGELHGGSSDGWSMRLFSELVASSQRERWSFGSENMSSNHRKRSNSQPNVSPPPADSQLCGVCSKLLKERSSWSSQKIVSNNELMVVAVLVCGHVYHAECLENVTPETDKYDPSCPICFSGEKSVLKLLGKGKTEIKGRNKISRNAVADIDLDGVSISEQRKTAEWKAKDPKLWFSSSFKSFGRPFLRRHFSIGSRPTRSVSENETTRKNFWGGHRRNE